MAAAAAAAAAAADPAALDAGVNDDNDAGTGPELLVKCYLVVDGDVKIRRFTVRTGADFGHWKRRVACVYGDAAPASFQLLYTGRRRFSLIFSLFLRLNNHFF